jgi:uncharacterized cupin superfamily protein
MSVDRAIMFAGDATHLDPAPIFRDWILEGNPVARGKALSVSHDKAAFTWIWDCTAGRFNWFYDIDETVYVIEGSVTVRDHHGATRTLVSGDIALFPAGSSAEWTVNEYVRKIAFLRRPPSPFVRLLQRVCNKLHRMTRIRSVKIATPTAFGVS